jgi:hypothetical protein
MNMLPRYWRDQVNREGDYFYRAWITDVIDGDTLHASVDLGLDVCASLTFELYGIKALEVGTKDGKTTKSAIESWLSDAGLSQNGEAPWQVFIKTIKNEKEKYGNYKVEVYGHKSALSVYASSAQLNSWLIAHGYANGA